VIWAANGVLASYDSLVDLLDPIEHFSSRLDIYTWIPPTPVTGKIRFKIIVELLSKLALVTKELKQGQASESILADVLPCLTEPNGVKFVKNDFRERDVEAFLQRLDRLTQDEALITAAQTLEVIYSLIKNISVIMDGEQMHLR
jgi:hypothetical protein